MAIWKEQPAPKQSPAATPAPEAARFEAPSIADIAGSTASAPTQATPARAVESQAKESLIAADITIEGKIQGSGHVRIAGQFKGDVNVEGDLTIEKGARLTGSVRANKIVIAGELEGNIDGARRVELLDTGMLNGDLNAGSFTVAAGSRMRGKVEFGFEEKGSKAVNGSKADSSLDS